MWTKAGHAPPDYNASVLCLHSSTGTQSFAKQRKVFLRCKWADFKKKQQQLNASLALHKHLTAPRFVLKSTGTILKSLILLDCQTPLYSALLLNASCCPLFTRESGVTYQLSLVDTYGKECCTESSKVTLHKSSVGVTWHSLNFLRLNQVCRLRILAVCPLFYNDRGTVVRGR